MSFVPPDDRGYDDDDNETKTKHDTNYDVTTSAGQQQLKRLLYTMYRNGQAPPSFSNALLNKILHKPGRDYFTTTTTSTTTTEKPSSARQKKKNHITIPNSFSEFHETLKFSNSHYGYAPPDRRVDMTSFNQRHEKLKDDEGMQKLRWMFDRSSPRGRSGRARNVTSLPNSVINETQNTSQEVTTTERPSKTKNHITIPDSFSEFHETLKFSNSHYGYAPPDRRDDMTSFNQRHEKLKKRQGDAKTALDV